MASFKSKVLNLYSVDEEKHFRVEPNETFVSVSYKNPQLEELPVSFLNVQANGVNVYDKMTQNKTDIDDETARAIAKENQVEADLATESTRAETKENEIQASLDAEKTRLSAQEQLEADALANEILARETQGINLQTAIDNEALTRSSADSAHTQQIVDETDRATAEEARIESALNSYEVANNQRVLDAEIAHADYVAENDVKVQDNTDAHNAYVLANDAKLDQEIADRTSAIDNVQSQITAMLDGSPEHLDQLAEIVARFDANGATYDSRLSDLEAVVSALVEQLSN